MKYPLLACAVGAIVGACLFYAMDSSAEDAHETPDPAALAATTPRADLSTPSRLPALNTTPGPSITPSVSPSTESADPWEQAGTRAEATLAREVSAGRRDHASERTIEDAFRAASLFSGADIPDVACGTTLCRLEVPTDPAGNPVENIDRIPEAIPWDHEMLSFRAPDQPSKITVLLSLPDHSLSITSSTAL